MSSNNSTTELHRGLEERHITLMSLGAAIGVGLFLGSGKAIQLAGPGILLAYAFSGLVMFFIMRALGEMAIQKPVAGSFSRYAREYLGPLPGFLTGWNYWFLWIVTCMAEITAVGVYMEYWFPGVPRWIWALAALVIMTIVNFLAVKAYGELEFWFALIKIVTIIFMIFIGLGMIVFGIGNGGIAIGIRNLWEHGGLFPNGVSGVMLSLQMVLFAFLGIEMIGVTAGEVKNPEKSLSRAIDNVFWRILIFYVGALFVVLSIYPWNEVGLKGSPFVLMFDQIGIPAAAGIINFVVLTAALSSCNSGIFSTSRMLFNLAEQGEAPKRVNRLTKGGVPGRAVVISAIALLIGVLLNYVVPEDVFTWVTSIATFGAIWTWAIILVSQIKYRKQLKAAEQNKLKYKMPLFPFSSYLSLAFLVFCVCLMAYAPDTRVAVIVGPLWFLLLICFYYGKGYHRRK
ncbi:putative amino acid permease YtnA [Paenibacillus larvae subsp. larvae]|uniref:Putative amino acid permease YtnA n=1 Tax=Paenibacillus larvae subsp. larvae TaxID=147375 RepID=A0A2L1UEF1_9BACL|nr:alanine permease AlaP [Paenibacillus larvae]AQZ48443.1 amino acid permease [Paenibacillus larvae subsp. pulvifaciens]AVF26452.1 putative amino acid permease YtnA [Paenibacillus larvae subsp. larvae]AVF31228.1 putative amino acid permease YtnA [Paenibacillus larvae subsp. larvae]MBH0341449.1 D-alanine/D-serine/glycine permease [Paenibacillus larvae]MCY7521813.1 alanine permease AlaP [Paenibacillus larvae]